MWFKFHLQQIFVFWCLITLIFAAIIVKFPEKTRHKRTIQYFFDGLLNTFKEKRSFTNGLPISNDHRTSTLLSLAKLSSISTPSKKFESEEEDQDRNSSGNSSTDNLDKPSTFIQLPIPTIDSLSLKTAENEVSQPMMTKRIEMDVKTILSTKNSSQEGTISQITTQAPNQTASKQTTTELNVTTESPGFTIAAEAANTENNLLDLKGNITLKNYIPTKLDNMNFSMRADRHTTQFFDGPLVVERHIDNQHIPIYEENCSENVCRHGVFPVISMTIALPRLTSNPRKTNDHPPSKYNIFTLHSFPISKP